MKIYKTICLTLCFFIIVIITGIVALVIIYQFIKIFQNLKNNILFCYDNSKRLNIVSNSCFILSSLYLIILIFLLLIMNKVIEEFIYYVFAFSIMLMVIFAVSGISARQTSRIIRHTVGFWRSTTPDGRSCGIPDEQAALLFPLAGSWNPGSHESGGRTLCGTGITGNRHLPAGTAGHPSRENPISGERSSPPAVLTMKVSVHSLQYRNRHQWPTE